MILLDQILILLAAVGFALLDLFRKLLAGRLRVVPLLFLLTAGVVPVYLLWFLVEGAPLPRPGYWTPALASVVINVLANLLYLRAVHLGEFSRTIPLLSLTPVFTAVVSVPLLGEVPGARQGAGIVLVVFGAVWLQRGSAGQGERLRSGIPASAWMMLAVAVLWSSTTPLDKLAMQHGTASLHATVLHVGIAVALGVWLLARGEFGGIRDVRSSPWLLLGALCASAVALAAQLLALERVFAAFLETLKRGWGGLAALVLGWLVFSEPLTWRKSLAVAVMIGGVAMLLLP